VFVIGWLVSLIPGVLTAKAPWAVGLGPGLGILLMVTTRQAAPIWQVAIPGVLGGMISSMLARSVKRSSPNGEEKSD
jgi:hypothetical protein